MNNNANTHKNTHSPSTPVSVLSAQDLYNNFAMHPDVIVDEGEHSVDGTFNRIEFTLKQYGITIVGEIGHNEDKLFFSSCYQIDDEIIELEFVVNHEEEYICFTSQDTASHYVNFKEGKVNGFKIIVNGWLYNFETQPGQAFPEFVGKSQQPAPAHLA